MSSRAIISAAVAAALALSALPSFAQGHDNQGRVIIIQQQPDGRYSDRRDDRRDQRAERRNDRRDDRYERRHDNRRDRWRQERAEQQRHYYYGARGPEFARGHAIPHDLRSRQYVVTNYHLHRLPPPPRGQQWVQVGADYVLVAIATGIIASIILNR